MFISEFKESSITLKLLGLLLFLVGIWFFNLLIPVHTYHPIAYNWTYPFRMLFICYFMVIIFSIIIIKKNKAKIKPNDLIIGFTLGALGGSTDIFLAITTILAYISSMVMLEESKTKILFIKKPRDHLDAFITITIIVFLYVLFYIRFNSFGSVPVSYGLYRALMPGITEEVMWRLFLFAIAMKITKGEFSDKYHKLIIWLILIVPFILAHEPRNYGMLGYPISYISIFGLFNLSFFSIIVTWLFLKRSLLSAILFHFFGNAYNFGFRYYEAGDYIFYWIQPSILEIVFGFGL